MTLQKCRKWPHKENGPLTSATAWSADSIFSKVTKAQLVRDRRQKLLNILSFFKHATVQKFGASKIFLLLLFGEDALN